MKLDLRFQIKDLSGNVIPGSAANAGNLVAVVLSAQTNHLSYEKAILIARKLLDVISPIEIDEVDIELLRKEIDESRTLYNISKIQILDAINSTIAKASESARVKGHEHCKDESKGVKSKKKNK
jgi:hypothetical protein